jgi:hypothetical protein
MTEFALRDGRVDAAVVGTSSALELSEYDGGFPFSIGDPGGFTASGFEKGGARGGPPGQFDGGGGGERVDGRVDGRGGGPPDQFDGRGGGPGGENFFLRSNEIMLETSLSLSLSLELYELPSSLEESYPILLFLKWSFGSSMPTKSAVRMIRSWNATMLLTSTFPPFETSPDKKPTQAT